MSKKDPISSQNQLFNLSSTLWQDICSQPIPETVSLLWKEHLKIREILEEMRKCNNNTQKPLYPERTERSLELERFSKWCGKMEIEAYKVIVASFESFGLGLKATGDIGEKDMLLKVPRRAMITLDTVRKSSMLKKAYELDPIVKGMDNVALALYILCEKYKGADSHWFDYLNILPENYSTPLYFTKDEMELLRPSPVFETSLKMYRNIARQFAYFHLMLAPKPKENTSRIQKKSNDKALPIFAKTPLDFWNFTFDAYKWAVSTITTRINMVPSDELVSNESTPMQIPALIPFLDMANHGPACIENKLSVHYDAVDNKALCTSTQNYTDGDHVTIFYGPRSSADHLVHNGFIPNSNRYDYYMAKLGIAKTDKLYDLRIEVLQRLNLKANEMFEIRLIDEAIPIEMYKFAQVFVSSVDGNDLQLMDTVELQKKAWKFLKDRFELLLHGYRNGKHQKLQEKSTSASQIFKLLDMEQAILENAAMFCDNKITELQS